MFFLVSFQVALQTKPIKDILRHTLEAWDEVAKKVFESAWVITGYFEAQHFDTFQGMTVEEGHHQAHLIMEPAQVLTGCTFKPTPQMCALYQWQIEDRNIIPRIR